MTQSILQTVVRVGVDSALRLEALGLDDVGLLEVVRRGELARATAVGHDPLVAASFDAWRHRVRALRDIFVPRGCTADREGNLELLRMVDGKRVIITRTGDAAVGQPNGFPQPTRTFGEQGASAIDANSLLFDPSWLNVESRQVGQPEIWLLLVCRTGDLVRAELSCPAGVNSDGRVRQWVERLILPEIDFSSNDTSRSDNAPAEIPDVPVSRKR